MSYFSSCVLVSCMSCLIYVYLNLPALKFDEEQESLDSYLKIPTTVGDAKRIGSLILRYKDDHYYSVIGAFLSVYILLQAFCIPGSIALSILAGYLFPAPFALVCICSCSTVGASTFYLMIYKHRLKLLKWLSKVGGGNRIEQFNNFVQSKVRQYQANIFLCVFVLRATPVFPNWSINLFSPIIDLPFRPFVLGTFFGIAPLSVIHVWTGRILNDLSNDESLFNWQSILMTSLLAISIVLLIYIKRIT